MKHMAMIEVKKCNKKFWRFNGLRWFQCWFWPQRRNSRLSVQAVQETSTLLRCINGLETIDKGDTSGRTVYR